MKNKAMREQDQLLQLPNFLSVVAEIELKLKNMKLQLEDCEKWFDEAYGKYKAEVKYWGRDQADSGEYITAGKEVELLKARVNELEWVLGLLPIEILNVNKRKCILGDELCRCKGTTFENFLRNGCENNQ